MPCLLSDSLSSLLAALPRKRCGNISTGKSLSSSRPNDESQRSSESELSVELVAAELPQEDPAVTDFIVNY